MHHPSLPKAIRFISIGSLLFAVIFFDQTENGREIDLESGRTRWFVKYPGLAEKSGPIEETAFSTFLKNRTEMAPAPPRWRKTTSSGVGRILSQTFHCYGHGGTEMSIRLFMLLIHEAHIDDVCRSKLVLELFARLRSDDPAAVNEYCERTLAALHAPERSKEPCERPDLFVPLKSQVRPAAEIGKPHG